jgi:spore photoproduct lyase
VTVKTLFIDADVKDHPETHTICSRLNLVPQYVVEPEQLFMSVNRADDPVAYGKSILFLTRNRGNFLKACPGTREYMCCDYQILHVASYCTMDCAYCILQIYFHPPMLQLFVNREDLDRELDTLFKRPGIHRLGTGEFSDSLIWEPWTDLNAHLISRFAAQEHCVLELKTKTVNIERLERLDHNRKTVVAWSLNTPRVIRCEERRTATLDARLNAARRCQEWGYPVAFHFDPLVIYEGCEAEYRDVLSRLFSRVAPDTIVWISLGTFRFMPALKPIIARRFPDSTIPYGEFITGLDNKMRYFKPLRIDLYRRLVGWIREAAPNVTVYFCMEDDIVWEQAIGYAPPPDGGVGHLLDRSAARICELTP